MDSLIRQILHSHALGGDNSCVELAVRVSGFVVQMLGLNPLYRVGYPNNMQAFSGRR